MTIHDPPPAPRFPTGFPVQVDYMGLRRADEQQCNRDGKPTDYGHVVRGVRLIPDVVETGTGDVDTPARDEVVYPRGWEYLIARFTDAGQWREWGWETESDLIDAGYVPPAARAVGPNERLVLAEVA